MDLTSSFVASLGISFFIWIFIVCMIFGAICQSIGKNKGRKGCFWYGFFLGWIGLIIVLCQKSLITDYSTEKNKYDVLEKLEELKNKQIISEEEYSHERNSIIVEKNKDVKSSENDTVIAIVVILVLIILGIAISYGII